MPKEIALLADQYLDGTIRERELRVLEDWLREDVAHADAFIDLADADQALRQAMAAGSDARLPWRGGAGTRALATRPGRWRIMAWPLAAAAAALAAAGMFLYVSSRVPLAVWSVTVAETHGTVAVERGPRVFPAAAGTVLRPGDRLRTEAGALVATTHSGTGDRVRLAAESELILESGAHRYRLVQGRLDAHLATGPDRDVVFSTPNAQVSVVGTRFELVAAPDLTRATVSEGRVILRDLARGEDVGVAAGQAAVVVAWARPTVFPWAATDGLLALYLFNEGQGDVVHDVSGIGAPMDLSIGRPENVEWLPDRLRIRSEADLACRTVSRLADAVRASGGLTMEAVWQAQPIGEEEEMRVFMNVGFGGRLVSWLHPRLKRMNLEDVGQPCHAAFVLDGSGDKPNLTIYGNGRMDSVSPLDGAWQKQIARPLDSLVVAPTLDARERRDGKFPWQGDLFLMAVYGRPLSAEEIGRHAAQALDALGVLSETDPDLPMGLGWDFREPADPETFRVFHGQWRHVPDRQCMETDGSELRMQLAVPLRGLPLLVEAGISSSNPKGLADEVPVNPPNLFFDKYEKHAVFARLRTREEMLVTGGRRYDSGWSRKLTSRFYVTDTAIVSVDAENRPREVFLYDRAPLEMGARLALRFPVSAMAPLNRLHQLSVHSVRPQDVPDVTPLRTALDALPDEKRTGALAIPDPRPGREGAVWVRFFEAGQATPFAAGSEPADMMP